MAESIQLGAGEQPASGTDNNAGSANAPDAGAQSAPLMARPDWVPEQFFKDGVIDYKGMASSYKELRTKMDSGKSAEGSEQPPAAGEQKPTGEAPKQDQAQAPTIPGVAPERVTHFTNEIQTGGKLSDESYAELAKLGYPKPVVDAYVRGLNADAEVSTKVEEAQIATKQIDEIKASIGGDEALKDMIDWAKATWSKDDLKVYNEAVGSRDVAKVKMAVQGLKAAYVEANGEQPNYLGGRKPTGVDGIEPFASEEEVANVMASREYKNSESFRQKVYARLKVSNVFAQSRDTTKVQR